MCVCVWMWSVHVCVNNVHVSVCEYMWLLVWIYVSGVIVTAWVDLWLCVGVMYVSPAFVTDCNWMCKSVYEWMHWEWMCGDVCVCRSLYLNAWVCKHMHVCVCFQMCLPVNVWVCACLCVWMSTCACMSDTGKCACAWGMCVNVWVCVLLTMSCTGS